MATIPIGRCLVTIRLSNFTGLTKLVIPITNRKLQIQLPMAFPIIKSECPSMAEVTVIKISGSDVPTANMVNPISISDKPNLFAILIADFTKKICPFY